MKKVITYIIFCTAIFNFSYSQTTDFLKYSNYVNTAELNIISNKLSLACLYYDSAFNIFSDPRAVDLHNGILCAKNIDDTSYCRKFINLMITNKSLKPDYYSKIKVKSFLTKEQKNQIKNNYQKRINSDTYKLLCDLCKKDQAIRTRKNYLIFPEKIREVDSLSRIQYFNSSNNTIYPEYETLDYPWDERKDYILMFHWSQKWSDVDSIYISAVRELKLNAHAYGFFSDTRRGVEFYNSDYGLVVYIQYKNKKKRISRSVEHINKINNKRSELGLECYEDYLKKIEYFEQNKQYCFPITGYIAIITGPVGKEMINEMN